MRKILAVALCLLFPPTVVAAGSGFHVKYDGGSLPNIKVGSKLTLELKGTEIDLMNKHELVQAIPASAVTDISYGQDVHRRVGAAIGVAVVSFGLGALMALTKSKKHYVGLTWALSDNKTKGGFAMQCDKNDYRGVITGLEGITGKKAVDTDAMNVKN
jgi:hypothetical protein